jgi:Fructose-bisphosphate aldolase class-I
MKYTIVAVVITNDAYAHLLKHIATTADLFLICMLVLSDLCVYRYYKQGARFAKWRAVIKV